MRIAVVTGASSGMGREFVLQLSRTEKLDEIWVIARRLERLEALQKEVENVKIRPISLDLTENTSLESYKALLEAECPDVAILVNASGYGRFGSFEDVPLDVHTNMIDLNVKAYVAMTHVTLPFMRAGGEIYQLDSLSSFQPLPYIGVYGATKSFVLSFSRAINVELKKRGIRVLAVCPGWVQTEFFDRAAKDDTITYYNRIYQPQDVIARAIRDMKRGRDVSVCGAATRMLVLLTKLLPHRLVMRIWCKQQKK